MMDVLQELVARDQIRQLAERYSLAVDGKDLEGIAALFSDAADFGSFGAGRDGVLNRYDHDLRRYHCTIHFVGNHVIDFDDDDHAHGVVYARAYHHVPEPDHWFDIAFAYWDTYERVGDVGWRFRDRQPKAWYRHPWGHPDEPNDRQELGGREPGAAMPDAFPTWAQFSEQPPRN
jgi:hypothetical protein